MILQLINISDKVLSKLDIQPDNIKMNPDNIMYSYNNKLFIKIYFYRIEMTKDGITDIIPNSDIDETYNYLNITIREAVTKV